MKKVKAQVQVRAVDPHSKYTGYAYDVEIIRPNSPV